MKLIFRGHDDRYAVEQSLLAFFPEERPVYKPAEEGEDHALVTLSRSPRFNTAVTTITYHGRAAGHHRPGEAAGAAGSRRRPHQR